MGRRETLGELLGRRDRSQRPRLQEPAETGSSKGTWKPGPVR